MPSAGRPQTAWRGASRGADRAGAKRRRGQREDAAIARLKEFWKGHSWTFWDGSRPALLTLTEFASVLRDFWHLPTDRKELATLGDLGAFAPQHILFVGRVLEEQQKIVDFAAPVYELAAIPEFIRQWRTHLSLHIPVATTTVEALRTKWGPKLRAARTEIGHGRSGQVAGRTVMMNLYHSLTGRTWEEIAKLDSASWPPLDYNLMSVASRYRRKARERVKKALHVKGILARHPGSPVDRGIARLRERAQADIERGRAALRQGTVVFPEDPDLILQVLTFGNS